MLNQLKEVLCFMLRFKALKTQNQKQAFMTCFYQIGGNFNMIFLDVLGLECGRYRHRNPEPPNLDSNIILN